MKRAPPLVGTRPPEWQGERGCLEQLGRLSRAVGAPAPTASAAEVGPSSRLEIRSALDEGAFDGVVAGRVAGAFAEAARLELGDQLVEHARVAADHHAVVL